MAMKQIFMPHGVRVHPHMSPDEIEQLRRDHAQRTEMALNEWQRAIREGFEVVSQYDTTDEGRAFAVFVMHRRGSKSGLMTPRMKMAQAAVTLDTALAQYARAQRTRRIFRVAAQADGSDEALAAMDAADAVVGSMHTKVIQAACKLLEAVNSMLDQTGVMR